ncbi:twin-arginine translocation pathway signal [Alteromonas sp. KUL49]|nr:twin-arginine translocation pathway signal [Alteromonas sp. KUL49]
MRRRTVKMALATAIGSTLGCSTAATTSSSPQASIRSEDTVFSDDWQSLSDQVWLGDKMWANPMEDWRVESGTAICDSQFGSRNVHWLTLQLDKPQAGFVTQVTVSNKSQTGFVGGAGFKLGIKSEIDDHRGHCFANNGIKAGVDNKGLFIDNKHLALTEVSELSEVNLVLSGQKQGQGIMLTLTASNVETHSVLGSITKLTDSDSLVGNIAISANSHIPHQTHLEAEKRDKGSLFSFANWQVSGLGVQHTAQNAWGPILWAMYTINEPSNKNTKDVALTAVMAPVSPLDNQTVELQIASNGEWITVAQDTIDPLCFVTNFRVKDLAMSSDTQYRVKYTRDLSKPDLSVFYEGVLKAPPAGNNLKMASLTCQNDYGFPYQPVVDNVLRYNPDIVFFSGDQIYEHHGGYGIVRSPTKPALLNYLRKYYQFGWAFKETMRNNPTVCLPDDHDVLQGNLWGEGGKPMENLTKDPSASLLGGYAESPEVVNAIHKTCVSHLPDPVNPDASEYGIGVYFTELNYANVSFAILADRQWKSWPSQLGILVGETGNEESPTEVNEAFDRNDMQLLGSKQEQFLKNWAQRWDGHKLKAVLSQTVFAGIATHQVNPRKYLKYDFDSSGWPASARNRAVEIMRESKALHICGDTHLGTLSQYGVNGQRNANWAFCSPAISAGWPRWWLPDNIDLPVGNRPSHNRPNTGEYKDAFGNPIYVYAVANPEEGRSKHRYIKAHEKGSGFGVINFNTENLTYEVAAYQFNVNISEDPTGSLYEGYPITIHQNENIGENKLY